MVEQHFPVGVEWDEVRWGQVWAWRTLGAARCMRADIDRDICCARRGSVAVQSRTAQ